MGTAIQIERRRWALDWEECEQRRCSRIKRSKITGPPFVENMHPSLSPIVSGIRPAGILLPAEPLVIALVEPEGIVATRSSFISRKIYYTGCRSSKAASFAGK